MPQPSAARTAPCRWRRSSLWSRTTALHLRILADVDAQREALAAAGVDMRKALESLGRADIAVQDFCSGASRSSNPGSEILHAQARRASATVGEVAAQVRQVRLRIQEKQGALRSVAG